MTRPNEQQIGIMKDEAHISQQQVILIDLLTFSCSVIISMVLCWIFLKTVPCLIAQEDIIYIGNVKKFQQRQ